MLTLLRKRDQAIYIGDSIKLVVYMAGMEDRAWVGIHANPMLRISRAELLSADEKQVIGDKANRYYGRHTVSVRDALYVGEDCLVRLLNAKVEGNQIGLDIYAQPDRVVCSPEDWPDHPMKLVAAQA